MVGTSDAAPLLRAHMADPSILAGCAEVGFIAVPGGGGPSVVVSGDRLVVGDGSSGHAAYAWPVTLDVGSIRAWDVVVISALGLVDTGYAYNFFGAQQGLLFDCRPKPHDRLPLMSRACYRAVVAAMLDGHAGVQFTRSLRAATDARVIIQPTPLLSAEVPNHDDWLLARLYDDPLRANAFFTDARLAFLETLADGIKADLLPFPNEGWKASGFTPAEFMDPRDGVHGNEAYGHLVLQQIADRLAATPAVGPA